MDWIVYMLSFLFHGLEKKTDIYDINHLLNDIKAATIETQILVLLICAVEYLISSMRVRIPPENELLYEHSSTQEPYFSISSSGLPFLHGVCSYQQST